MFKRAALPGLGRSLMLACLMGGLSHAWAAPASTTASASTTPLKGDAADQLVEMVHAPTLAQQPVALLSRYAKQKADAALKAQPDLSTVQQQQLAQLPDRVRQVVERNLKWGALLQAYASTYRRIYTPEEIQAQLRFYRSKEGQSVLKKQEQLSNQLIVQTSVSLKPVYAALQKTIDEQVATIVAPASAASAP